MIWFSSHKKYTLRYVVTSFHLSFDRRQTHTTQWTQNSALLSNDLCRYIYKTWMEGTYDIPYNFFFFHDYWIKSDGFFAEMQNPKSYAD